MSNVMKLSQVKGVLMTKQDVKWAEEFLAMLVSAAEAELGKQVIVIDGKKVVLSLTGSK